MDSELKDAFRCKHQMSSSGSNNQLAKQYNTGSGVKNIFYVIAFIALLLADWLLPLLDACM